MMSYYNGGFQTAGHWLKVEILISVFLDIYPEVGLLDRMVVLFLIFLGTSILFSIAAALFYIPTNSAQGFQFLHILTYKMLLSLISSVISILTGVR